MKRRFKQILASTLLACMMAVIIPFQLITALAAEAKISFSDPSVMVGKEVSVAMKVNSVGGEPLGGVDVTLSYDPNVLEFVSGANASGGAGSVRVIGAMDSANTTSFKFTLKFKALQAGKTSITVARQEVNDVNTQPVTVSKVGNSTVNVTPLATYSNNAALKSLKIDPGTLTPEFNSKVTEYTATVGPDVSKLVVSAGTANANAKVVISGTDLKEGENTVVCKVTAEDGETVKKYTIKVTKTAEASTEASAAGGQTKLSDVKATVDGGEYFVASAIDPSLLPAGFQAGKITYQDKEVASATGNGMTLLYLADTNGNSGFYIYDEASGNLSPFVSVSSAQLMVIPSEPDEGVTVPQGFVDSSIEIDGNTIKGWVWSGEGQQSPYFIFYGTSSSGQKDFYRYDATEKTLQRYFQDPNADSGVSTEKYVDVAEKYNSLIKDYNMRFIIICLLIALSVVLLIIVVMLMMGRKGSPHDPDNRMKGKKEKQKSARKTSALDFLEDDEDDEFDDYYDEPYEEDEPGGASRNRREKDKARTASIKSRYEDSEEDDFEEIENLEDMERTLAAHLAREAELGESGRVKPAVRRRAQTSVPGNQERRRNSNAAEYMGQGYEQPAGAAYHRVQSERRPRGQELAGRPAQSREPAGHQAKSQDEADYPDQSQGAPRRRGQGGVRYPTQDQAAARRPGQVQSGMRYPAQDEVRRPVPGGMRHPEQDEVRRPVRGGMRHPEQDMTRRPIQGGMRQPEQDMTRRPIQGGMRHPEQDEVRRPVRGGMRHPEQDEVRRPVPGGMRHPEQDMTRRPVQDGMRRPLQVQEVTRRPVQDGTRRPVQGGMRHPEQDMTRRPVQGGMRYPEQDEVRRPVQGGMRHSEQDMTRRPVQGGMRHPEQDEVRRPVQGGMRHPAQDVTRRPVQGGMRHPEQDMTRRPIQGGMRHPEQDMTRRPVQGGMRYPEQDEVRRPVQDGMRRPAQEPARRSSQGYQPGRAQNEAAAYRQTQRRTGPRNDDDFEILDLD